MADTKRIPASNAGFSIKRKARILDGSLSAIISIVPLALILLITEYKVEILDGSLPVSISYWIS